MNKFKKDENVINSDQAKNASKQADGPKLGNNVPSHIEEVANSYQKEPVINPEQSEKK